MTYLVTTCTEGRTPVFADFYYGRVLVNELRQAEAQGLVRSLAWVVMPDHVHWLFVLERGSLAGLVRQIKACSALKVNRQAGLRWLRWQTGYHDTVVRDERQLLELARYTIANPVRGGLVQRVGDYALWDAVWLGVEDL